MKLTIWQGFKLAGWLITSFLVSLMLVAYIVDYKQSSMDIMFYANKIIIIIFLWILLYLSRFVFRKLSKLKKY
ncbi:MAG: hypothetical protein CFH21_00491 [Alphaproteobacteria bacterium MarineAlpha5_Bin11]|nr:hypothetical protein [Pelagibacteraceae bacterium]PPR44124.1 MAG: hypothetical protein CFH21_00491 [Alphaproteobacteria bacterium MarineAlpha5_Bin11]PPR50841.1 MAG: hypothetical protein CFH20_00874 [Alphaproteobacteria bacterium MarineAlpha5_Bin10]